MPSLSLSLKHTHTQGRSRKEGFRGRRRSELCRHRQAKLAAPALDAMTDIADDKPFSVAATIGDSVQAGKRTTILSIDGGGIRGVIPATILQYFEEQLQILDGPNARIVDYFDVITGTSTGGIIGGILTAPDDKGLPLFTAADALKFYIEEGPKVFANRFIPFISQLIGPKHDASILEKALKDNLKEIKIKDTVTELIIPTFDINLMQPTYFSTSEAKQDELKNAYLRDVLRGTSAAPTYFSPYFFQTTSTKGESRAFNLVDGGVGINNPAHLSIIHTLYQTWKNKSTQSGGPLTIQDYKSLLVLSLGTGKAVKSYSATIASKWGTLSWILKSGKVPILDIISECSADVVDYNLNVLFHALECQDNYLRIQAFDLSSDVTSLDNAASDNIQRLKEVGENLLNMPVAGLNIENGATFPEQDQGTNKEALQRFARELSKERIARRSLATVSKS